MGKKFTSAPTSKKSGRHHIDGDRDGKQYIAKKLNDNGGRLTVGIGTARQADA
ncbi:hypothetical protein ACVXG7_10120 [Enterobacter hormaechei]